MHDLAKRIKDSRKRWNLPERGDSLQEFKDFKTRVLSVFKGVDRHLSDKEVKRFCRAFAIKEYWNGFDDDDKWGSNVFDALDSEDDPKKFFVLLDAVLDLDIQELDGYGRTIYSREMLLADFKEAVGFSQIDLEIGEVDGEMFLYPAGVKMLDEDIVNGPLEFLNPEASHHFVDALKYYEEKNPAASIKSAEQLRKTVEEFLHFKLGNNANLASNIFTLLGRLKADDRDVEIRKIIQTVLSHVDNYFNENSKHRDGDIDEVENEYLIYQVGTLLRYIDRAVKTPEKKG